MREPVQTTVATSTPTWLELDEALSEQGFDAQDGLFYVSALDGCCDPGANCYGNNPTTPYGTPAVPPSHGDVIDFVDVVADWGALPNAGVSRTFRMRSDEVILLLGDLPPASRYFSYRSYLGDRAGYAPDATLASLGASLNNTVIAAHMGTEDIWGQRVAILTSADAVAEEAVRQALLNSGWQNTHILTDRMEPGFSDYGLEADSDRFFAVMRSAVYDDPQAGADWLSRADWQVLRLTPRKPFAGHTRHEPADLPVRGDGQTETAWIQAVIDLGLAIHEFYPNPNYLGTRTVPYWAETFECLDEGLACAGDIRDRLMLVSTLFYLDDDEDFVVAYGVNHARTGKASYSNVSVQTQQTLAGVDTRHTEEMAGTARFFLPEHPLVDDLYAYVITRDCSRFDVACIEVPTDVCPGARLDEQLKVSIRVYLEPSTGAAPLDTEIIADRVIKFE